MWFDVGFTHVTPDVGYVSCLTRQNVTREMVLFGHVRLTATHGTHPDVSFETRIAVFNASFPLVVLVIATHTQTSSSVTDLRPTHTHTHTPERLSLT